MSESLLFFFKNFINSQIPVINFELEVVTNWLDHVIKSHNGERQLDSGKIGHSEGGLSSKYIIVEPREIHPLCTNLNVLSS